jgi:hypothetical protein
MVGCMLGLVVTKLIMSDETMKALRVTYWADATALCAFGFAWIVADKYFRPFVDKEEALRLFGR